MKTPVSVSHYRALIKEAVKLARKEDPRIIGREPLFGTPFKVQVESIRVKPSGGHCRAFAYWYSIVENDNRVIFGCIDRADSFVALASPWLAFRMMSGSLLALYAADGWKAAQDETKWRINNLEVR